MTKKTRTATPRELPEPIWTELHELRAAFRPLSTSATHAHKLHAHLDSLEREAITELGKKHGYSERELIARGIIAERRANR